MEVVKLVIGLILISIGVVFIYDARKITEKLFSFSDKNEGTRWTKLGGFLISIIGCLIIFLIPS